MAWFSHPRKQQRALTSLASEAPSSLWLQALEPRVLLDAATAATAASAVKVVEAAHAAEVPDAAAASADLVHALQQVSAQFVAPPPPVNVYFIDRTLPDTQALVASLGPAAEVHFIEPGADGLQTIAQALQGRSNIASIQIVSHGGEAELHLGRDILTDTSMQGEYRDVLAAIGSSLSANGDILIYGCDFAEGADGQRAMQVLAGITGADVAASKDATGAASLGGDWTLESHVGNIEAQPIAAPDWDHLAAAPTLTLDADNSTGVGGGGFKIASGPGGSFPTRITDTDVSAADADGDIKSLTLTMAGFANGVNESITFGLGNGAKYVRMDGVAHAPMLIAAGGTTFKVDFDGTQITVTRDGGGNIPTADLNALMSNIGYKNDVAAASAVVGNRTVSFVLSDGTSSSAARVSTIGGTKQPRFINSTDGYGTINASNTQMVTIALGSSTFVTAPSNGFGYNAVGFNVADGYAYGINQANLVRIGSDGSAVIVGPINSAGAPSTFAGAFIAGDIGPDGLLYAFNGTSKELHAINVTTNTYVRSITFNTPGATPNIADIAWRAADDKFYGVAPGIGLVSIDRTTGATIVIGATGVNGAFGGMYADATGSVYGISTTTGQVYKFDLTTGKATAVPNTNLGAFSGSDAFASSAGRLTNSPPIAVNDGVFAVTTGSLVLNPMVNDSDADGDVLRVSAIAGVTITPGLIQNIPVLHGTVQVARDGTITYIPTPGYVGPSSFDYTVDDGFGGQATATESFNVVAPPNRPPVPVNDTGTATEDSPLVVSASTGLLANDVDPDGDTLSITSFTVAGVAGTITAGNPATIPGVGVLTINADGGYRFVPAPNYNGPVPVATYTVSDGLVSATATLTLTVTADNDPPVAANDTGTATEDIPLVVPKASGLLANDTDVDGDTLTITGFTIAGISGTRPVGSPTTIPGVGALTINADGSYSFTPAPNYHGPVPVATYTVSDGQVTTTATLTLSVTSVNDPPAPANDTGTATEDTPLVVPKATGLLANDTDVDGDTLTITSFTVPGVAGIITAGSPATIPGVGVLTINPDGSYSFTPAPNYNGAVPVATYTVSDGVATSTATLTLTVTAVNDPPTPVNDTGTATEDTPLIVPAASGLLSNDSDPDGDPLTIVEFNVPGLIGTTPAGSPATIPGVGVLVINANGSYSFTPEPNYNGPVPLVSYTVSDGKDTTDGTLTLSVTPVNDPPVAGDDDIGTPRDTPVPVDLLGNDTDVDGDTLTIFSINGVVLTPGAAQDIPVAGGSVHVAANGDLIFNPAPGFVGTGQFDYVVQDPSGAQGTGTANVTVSDIPLAQDDGPQPTEPGTPASGNVLDNDIAGVGPPITVTQFTLDINGDGTPEVFAVPPGGSATTPLTDNTGKAIGTMVIGANGDYTFTPDPGYKGPVPVATYTISNGISTATATLGFDDVPDAPPVAANDGPFTTVPNTPVNGVLLPNDSDPNGDPVTVTRFSIDVDGDGTDEDFTVPPGGSFTAPIKDASGKAIGTLTIGSGGSFTFTPDPAWGGPVPVASYTVSDGTLTGEATLAFTDVPNVPPVAVDDGPVATAHDTPVTGNLLTNDTDANGDPLTVTQFTIDTNGDGTPDGPFAVPPGGSVPINILDASHNPLGTMVIGSDGTFTFTPAPTYKGPVPATTYTVSDGVSTDTGTLSFADVPDAPPVATADGPFVTVANVPVSGNVLTNDTDPNTADTLTVTQFSVDIDGDGTPDVFTVPTGGTATATVKDNVGKTVGTVTLGSDGAFSFVPDPAWKGPVPVTTYTLSDGSATDTATLSFDDVPDRPPVATADGLIPTASNTPVSGNVLTNDTDPNGDTLTVTQFTVATDGALVSFDVPPGGSYTATLRDTTGNPIGTLTIGSDGAFTFTPDELFKGPVPVTTYTVSDGTTTADSTLSFANVPNAPPVAVDDGPIITSPNAPVLGNMLDNDINSNDEPLTVTQFSIDTNGDGTPEVFTVPPGGSITANLTDSSGTPIGTLTITSTGDYTFTPTPTYKGPVPATTYTTSDGGSTDTGILGFADVPDAPPVAQALGPLPTAPDTPVSANVLTTATDPNGDPLTVTQFAVDLDGDGKPDALIFPPGGGTISVPATDASQRAIGTFDFGSDGSVTFTPAPGYQGPVPLVSFTVSDGTNDDTAFLTFANVPDLPPVAVDDGPVPTLPGAPVSGNALANDTDPNSDPLTLTQFTVDTNGDGTPEVFTVPLGGSVEVPLADAGNHPLGTLVIGSDGSYAFTPAPGYRGPVPASSYTVSDGLQTDTGTLSFADVPNAPPAPGNDGPVAIVPDTPVSGNVIANDIDPNGDPLTVTAFSVDTDGDGVPETFTVPAGGSATASIKDNSGNPVGTLTLDSDGRYIFTPAPGYRGPVPGASVTVSDGIDTATSTLGFADVPTLPPVVAGETVSTDENTPLVVAGPGLLANDSDPEGHALHVASYAVDGLPGTIAAGQPTDIPGVGVLTINADGSYSFVPAPNFSGAVPGVHYTVADSDGGETTASLVIAVKAVNEPPVVANQAATVTAGGSLDVGARNGLLSNDSDPDGDSLTISNFYVAGVPGPVAAGVPLVIDGVGTLTVNADGSYSFKPVPDFTGDLVVDFTVADGRGGFTAGTLTLHVELPNLYLGDYPFVYAPEEAPSFEGAGGLPPPASGVILGVVNDIAWLGGAGPDLAMEPALRAGVGMDRPWRLGEDGVQRDRVADRLGLRARDGFDVAPRSIMSLRTADVRLELYAVEQQVWIDVNDQPASGKSPITQVQVAMGNGSARPAWIRTDGRGYIAIDRPAGTERLQLRITVERRNGASRSHVIEIDFNGGEMRQLGKTVEHKAGKDTPKAGGKTASLDFAAQLALAMRRPSTADPELLAALAWQEEAVALALD
ncbi:Ig-like domain-containing protein [Variovorax sp. dw_308]|uniref:Ig-like domain-containing protein n=1 Tax=Variovorax sp. dw_308 TaxID=2721546 RepID=UPI001C4881DB|nr:Ig-like domain-containing protein [Variovorax sp. dw_308]